MAHGVKIDHLCEFLASGNKYPKNNFVVKVFSSVLWANGNFAICLENQNYRVNCSSVLYLELQL